MHINRETYEEFFLLYIDGELLPEQRKAVDVFVSENPDLAKELLLLQQASFTADEQIVFENKEILYREEDRKVIAFPWFRIAAAAILLLSFGIFGWIYISNKKTVEKDSIAATDVQEKKNETENIITPAIVLPEKTLIPEEIKSSNNKPAKVEVKNNNTAGAIKKNKSGNSTKEIKAVENIPVETFTEESAEFKNEVAVTEVPKEEIDIKVVPRKIEKENVEGTALAALPNVRYGESEDDNMIYFANTSLPKKTKLRGVFRKASRILDKVTSFQ